jgi:hypothetical protein
LVASTINQIETRMIAKTISATLRQRCGRSGRPRDNHRLPEDQAEKQQQANS